MKNKLFIICPFSQMESYLQNKYGREIYFITAPASVVEWGRNQFTAALSEFIERHCIGEIYHVTDTGCRFINNVVNGVKFCSLPSEKVIRDIYRKHLVSGSENKEALTRQFKLAELTVKAQAEEIMKWSVLGTRIIEHKIELKGLVTTKEKNLVTEINIHN